MADLERRSRIDEVFAAIGLLLITYGVYVYVRHQYAL